VSRSQTLAAVVGDCGEDYEVLGPPDIEDRIGLTGGHMIRRR
jgi:hypothetical protein